MFLCSKLPCLGWRSANFLQGFFRQKCLLDQRKHTHSSTKISMVALKSKEVASLNTLCSVAKD
jgi:hypothetical protein